MIIRDKNNFPINLGDIVVIHQNGILYGYLGLVTGIYCYDDINFISVMFDEKSDLNFDSKNIEVIGNLESNVFDGFDTNVELPFHQARLIETQPSHFDWKDLDIDSKFLKEFQKKWYYIPQPRRFSVINICWSERGRGFGEYQIWEDNGKIMLDTECDSKESVKKVLCRMIDQAEIVK